MTASDSFDRADPGAPPEPRQRREVDGDAAYDAYRETDEYARNAAIGARSALMRDAAWERVAAEPPDVRPRWTGRLLETTRDADPVGEWLAQACPAEQSLLVRLLVRAAASEEGRGRDLLIASALDTARELARACARSIAWDMAEAAESINKEGTK